MLDRFETFVRSISQIQKNVLRIKSLEMHEFGLKGPHAMCIFCLSRHEGGMTAAELCRAIEIDKAAISRVLRELDAGGLIRYPDGRRYRARIELTADGETVAKAVAVRIASIVERIGSGLTDGEREVFYTALECIGKNLEILVNEGEQA